MSLNSHLRRHLYIICSIFTLLMVGCAGKDHATLEKADAIMEEAPDSALMMLQEINRNHLNKSDLPYYALLKTQALVKTNEPVSSDSLISLAYKKYSDDWWGDKGIRSNFYMAEVFYNQEKPREAMTFYLHAYEESKRLNNPYWRAKSAERIADLFFDSFDYKETVKYRKEAIKYYGEANRKYNQRFAVVDLATTLLNDSRNNDAIIILDSILSIAKVENTYDTLLHDYIRRSRIDVLVALGRNDELTADDLLLLEHPKSDKARLDNKILIFQIENSKNNSNLNDEMINDILASAYTYEDKGLALYAYYQYLKSNPGSIIEVSMIDSLLYYHDAITENIIKESVKGSERDFYSNLANKNREKARLQLLITIIIIVLVSITGFILWRFIKLRNIIQRAELESKVESLVEMKIYSDKIIAEKTALSKEIKDRKAAVEALIQKTEFQSSIINKLGKEANDNKQVIDDMKKEQVDLLKHLDMMRIMLEHQTEQHKQHIKDLKNKYDNNNEANNRIIESLFKHKWSTLNRLCVEYYEKGALRKFHEILIKEIESEVKNIGSKEGLIQIEDEVNQYLDGIISKLREECKALKEKDINLCCLIFAGFSVKAICFILDITSNNFYVKKKRLIQKISNSDSSNKNIFLNRF